MGSRWKPAAESVDAKEKIPTGGADTILVTHTQKQTRKFSRASVVPDSSNTSCIYQVPFC